MNPPKDGINRREFHQLIAFFLAMAGLPSVARAIPKDNTGYWTHRIANNVPDDWKMIEKGLADEWEHWNDTRKHSGNGILQDLMLGTMRYENPPDFNPWVTDRERKIVAMIIQWLGTNVGRSFLYEASKRMGRPVYPFQPRNPLQA